MILAIIWSIIMIFTQQPKPGDHFANDHFADHFAKMKQLRVSAAPIILVGDHFSGRKLYHAFTFSDVSRVVSGRFAVWGTQFVHALIERPLRAIKSMENDVGVIVEYRSISDPTRTQIWFAPIRTQIWFASKI